MEQVPIRFAPSRARDLLRAALLATGLIAPATGVAAEEESFTLSLAQTRQLAVLALQSGDLGLAVRAAEGLLQANPGDPFAHYVMAAALLQLDRPEPARGAAARAYRNARTGPDRFGAAQLAARAAYVGGHPTLAQLWLRRAAIHAPDRRAEAVVARDYRVLRRQNPWAFRLRAEMRPSSNVNKGADSALQIIDGVPVTGWLSGAAQALSGLIGSADIQSSYRFRQTRDSATSLAGRLYVQRVALSAEARAIAPRARNGDYASTFVEMSLRHGFRAGPRERGGTAAFAFAGGESWWGGYRSFRYARLSAERDWQLGATRVDLRALAERRFMARYSVNDARILEFGAEIDRPLANGDRLSWTLAWRDTDARHPNGTYRSASMRLGYSFGQPVGPVRLSVGLVLGWSDYPVFWSGGFIRVPGGRQDRSAYGDVNMLFSRYDYAGFAPMLRLRAGRKDSNDSRYSMKEFSISLSMESKF